MEGIVCGSLCFDSCDITRMPCELARNALRLSVVAFSNVIPTGFFESPVSIRGADSRAGHVALIGFGGDALGLFAYE
jgi:hypothetical protein